MNTTATLKHNDLTAETKHCLYCGQESFQKSYCCAACESLHRLVGDAGEIAPAVSVKPEYSHLDQANFKDLYCHSKTENAFVFYAKGMHCSSCVHTLEKLAKYCPSVVDSRANFAASTVTVRLTENGSLAEVASVIEQLGYEPSLLAPEEDGKSKEREEGQVFLRRLAVAGFCAGNMMLFVVPIYAGLAGDLKDIFNWLSFLLFLPVLLYSSVPFYRGALTSLRYKIISVDLPIAVALSAGFIFSTVNLVRGDGAIYYDSTASFLFFILCARYLLKNVQKRQLAAPSLKSSLKLEKYQRPKGLQTLAASEFETVPFSAIRSSDVLRISAGQTIPADSKLLAAKALIDLSLFNGESLPRHFTKNMALLGGTKNLQYPILVRVEKSFEESKIGQLCRQLESSQTVRNKFTALTDTLAQKLILLVFTVAVLFFVLYSIVDVSEAFNRALALLVLACPCALAFGAPLTYGMALRRSLQSGIIVKDPEVFEKLLTAENVFFDKTGTLTEGRLRLTQSEPSEISSDLKRVLLSLESNSYHPVAFALREAWPEQKELSAVHDAQEILGYGVKGIIEETSYEIRTLAESTHENEVAVEVLQDGQSILRLYFSDTLREDSRSVIQKLASQGIKTFLLSGDRKERCQTIAAECEIPVSHCHGDLFPEDKEKLLKNFKNTVMLGDGANDALSLKSADVGIAVKGSVDLSLLYANVYFTRGGLKPLVQLLKMAKQTRRVLHRNLIISLVYNLIGGTLALLGWIDPMLAAILMPLSSSAIIFSTLWGFR